MAGPYALGLLPRRHRFPAHWWHWYRLALVVVLVAAGVTVGTWLPTHLECHDGLPSNAVWRDGADCVGVTSGAYDFGLPRFDPVMARFEQQNHDAGTDCQPGATPITVGLLVTLNSPNDGGRDVHELEGFAAAQAEANAADCAHPVKVEVANSGSTEQAATEVAAKLKAEPDVVAVVGLGVSSAATAAAADLLGAQPDPVPMVGDLSSAEQFDAGGAPADQGINFSSCAVQYPDGIGHGNFYRVAYPNSSQVTALAKTLGSTPVDLIVTPTDRSDPYTCTTVPLVEKLYGGRVPQVKFDTTDTSTVQQSANAICNRPGPVTLFYTARSADLAQFIDNLDAVNSNGRCQPPSITVLSTSDASRMRVPETSPVTEPVRLGALNSTIFRGNGKLRLVYTPLADDGSLSGPEFGRLRGAILAQGRPAADLDDGWAIVAHDALYAVSRTTDGALRATLPVLRTNVSGSLNSLQTGTPLDGADGTLELDNDNDRIGLPTVVRLCSTGGSTNRTVVVGPGAARTVPCP